MFVVLLHEKEALCSETFVSYQGSHKTKSLHSMDSSYILCLSNMYFSHYKKVYYIIQQKKF